MIVTMRDIITFIEAAAANKYSIYSVREGPQNKTHVDSAGTHDANKPDFSRILQSGNSSQVSSAVYSPMAYET
jgi:hypothetical protein